MILSRCCKDGVNVIHDYYVCETCDRACDTISSLNWTGESDEFGYSTEAQEIFG